MITRPATMASGRGEKGRGGTIANIYACIYACMRACMRACGLACMHARMHICMHAGRHACSYACAYAHTHACIYVSYMYHKCMRICIHTASGKTLLDQQNVIEMVLQFLQEFAGGHREFEHFVKRAHSELARHLEAHPDSVCRLVAPHEYAAWNDIGIITIIAIIITVTSCSTS